MMMMTVMMIMMIVMMTMVAALRKSRGLIQLMVDGSLTQMKNYYGRWN